MLTRLVNAMRLHTHIVISLTTGGAYAEKLETSGHTVYLLGLKVSTAWRALPRLWWLIWRESPHVVQTWMYHSDFLGGMIARFAGVKSVIWNVRNSEIPQKSISITGVIIRLCAALSSLIPQAIVCCAHAGLERHAKLGYARSRMLVIPNGYDFRKWREKTISRDKARSDLKIPSAAFVIGTVGRFDSLKGYDVLIAASKHIAKHVPRAIFLLVGRDLDSNNLKLQTLIKRNGGGAVFRLLGERTDIASIMSSIDVYCLPSNAEGFPNSVAEAMLMQVPCVVTDVGDASRIVGSTGKVVPPRDPVALAQAIISIERMGEKARRTKGKDARQRIVDNYDINEVARNYARLYERVY